MMKCLYNHEMLINFTTQTPYQSYERPVAEAQFTGYIEELADTDVDAVACCPTAWRLPVYRSQVNPVWETRGREWVEPLPEADWKYFDKVFARVRRWMLADDYRDAVAITLEATRKIGREFLLSYRMNDNHYTHYNGERVPPTLDPLWCDHPEWRIPAMNGVRSAMNYLEEGVRDWYYRILEELIEMYDADGLELDFMRAPDLFPPGKTAEGTPVLTEFVGSIRAMLDRFGKERGRHLKLGVRIPWTPERALAAGFDLVRWQNAGWLDFINVSTHFRTTAEADMRGFRRALPGAHLLGELHFCSGAAHGPVSGIGGTRKTTREIYRTTAGSYLEQGADGVSLFNFCYVRDHHFNDPRLRCYITPEPPFDVLKGITDRAFLAGQPRHYNWCGGFGQLPREFPAPKAADFSLYLADTEFGDAVLRLQFENPGIFPDAVAAEWNGTPVAMIPGSGELSTPEDNEGQANPLELFFFRVPKELLKHGENNFRLFVSPFAEFFLAGVRKNRLTGIELAFEKGK